MLFLDYFSQTPDFVTVSKVLHFNYGKIRRRKYIHNIYNMLLTFARRRHITGFVRFQGEDCRERRFFPNMLKITHIPNMHRFIRKDLL